MTIKDNVQCFVLDCFSLSFVVLKYLTIKDNTHGVVFCCLFIWPLMSYLATLPVDSQIKGSYIQTDFSYNGAEIIWRLKGERLTLQYVKKNVVKAWHNKELKPLSGRKRATDNTPVDFAKISDCRCPPFSLPHFQPTNSLVELKRIAHTKKQKERELLNFVNETLNVKRIANTKKLKGKRTSELCHWYPLHEKNRLNEKTDGKRALFQ